jgi:MOSC domain-containing protein YiiM
MKLLSVNVGSPQPFSYNGKEGMTSIFKSPVTGSRKVFYHNVEGDKQGDLTVHGGELKAVYSYDIAYYHYWKTVLQRDDWNYGLFGENLTTEDLKDDVVLIGNVYKIGSTYLRAIKPRFPCFKLNIRFGMDDMLQQFAKQKFYGTYYKIEQEGTIQAGDTIVLAEQSNHEVSIQQFVEAYLNKGADKNIVDQILAIEFLSEKKRKVFESYLH